ncbi:putative bifunctional diguanylate cyclase/phosphodiesterase [Paludibacterium denitrificans]|uniref:putative bifunctional diguanylate cyclase/phosphodiesterase n=1 Tax=Paludibacterium denitrificans TaxID=2675226 RepID=UPI001E5F7168|nr:EAL domain-containing protein [Paludibacterium denitrificans]
MRLISACRWKWPSASAPSSISNSPAFHDPLTGLPNRVLVRQQFQALAADANSARSRLALVFVDADGFKTVNDSLGHAVGDELLKGMTQRFAQSLRASDTLSREGGDEFLLILGDLSHADAAASVLNDLMESLQRPFALEGHQLSTSVSMGVAVYPDDGTDFDTLLKKADMAMFRAKAEGRSTYRFFDEGMNAEAAERLNIENGLRLALAQQELALHYQPQIDLASGLLVGAEALLRWQHPQQGMLSPGLFIPIAEESGLIVPIGEWVIASACQQAARWQRAGLPPFVVAVNLSALQFLRGDIVASVEAALQQSGLAPQYLELELTESILIQNTAKVLAITQRLSALGVQLSIDDFGTGYSSLSYLKRLKVDKLKIDQSFVRDLASDADSSAITGTIIQLARSTGLALHCRRRGKPAGTSHTAKHGL